MNESLVTKQALSQALQAMMEERAFEKITVSALCACCGIQRKSFYYHFKDKYDLLHWIFDRDVRAFMQASISPCTGKQRADELRRICKYFEAHRTFYLVAFKVQGQNDFKKHCKNSVIPFMKMRFDSCDPFELQLMVEAAMSALEHWLLMQPEMSADEFVDRLIQFGEHAATLLERDLTSLG